MNNRLADSLWADEVYRKALAPPPRLSVSEWADRNRILPSLTAEPGPWHTGRTPYLREIMDCLSENSPWEKVVFMKGAQIGATEAGLNWLGYIIDHCPATTLLVMPSIDAIRRNTAARINPLIEICPTLREKVSEFKSKDSQNSTTKKTFPGGLLVMTGANSAIGLRSLPARFLFLDEVDGYPHDADGEGDPVQLATQRTVTFRASRKILMASTPTLAGFSRIEKAYEESDQRYFFVPCPECQTFQVIEWEAIRWPMGEPEKAALACKSCGVLIPEFEKPAMLAKGEWRASHKGDGKSAGFHLSALYSPFETWAEIAREFLTVRKDPPRLKTWRNLKLGLCWEDQASVKIKTHVLAGRRTVFGLALPADVVCLTAGADCQDDRLEVTIWAWGRDYQAWVLAHHVIHGNPALPEIWDALDRLLEKPYPHSRALPDMQIRAAAIDSGGHHTASVYRFCSTRASRRIWAIKGRGGEGIPAWPRRPTKLSKGQGRLYLIGVDGLKDQLSARLRIEEIGAGHIHFNASLTDSFFEQLTAERVIIRYKAGRPVRVWEVENNHTRNEALDCAVYAAAALAGLESMGLNLNEEAMQLDDYPLKAEVTAGQPERPTQPRQIYKSPWLNR